MSNYPVPASTSVNIGFTDNVTKYCYFKGTVHEVQYYNVALNSTQVAANFSRISRKFNSYSVYDGCNAIPYTVYVASGSLTIGNTVYYNINFTNPVANKTLSQTVWPDDPTFINTGIITNGSGVITAINQSVGGCNVATYC
jgi:hypothetical protein